VTRPAAAALAVVGAAVAWLLLRGSPDPPAGGPVRPSPPAVSAEEGRRPQPPSEDGGRDPFAFADDTGHLAPPGPLAPPGAAEAVSPPPALLPPPVAPVRLVGFVEAAEGLRAALVVHGETVVLGAGESHAGFRVLSLDLEGGVVLADAAGRRVALTAAAR
jgi:hypothetical protein